MSAVLAYSNTTEETPALKRGTLTSAFNRAAKNEKPAQPHADGSLLIAEGFIAQDILKQVGQALTEMLPKSEFEIGPEKDLDRALTKVQKKGTDLSQNCDFSRARMFTGMSQMKKMIDTFGERGPVTVKSGDKEFNLHVVDVDNTFSIPNPKKPGLCNLDIKLLVPFTLESGEQSYHICELQFILKSMRKDWNVSHGFANDARVHETRIQALDELMENLDTNSGSAYRRLEAARDEALQKKIAANNARNEANIKNARKAGADQLAGYQPCRKDSAEIVAPQPTKDYIKLVPA